MGLKKCPICGEKFADTYKRCPFCEEDENPRKARQPKRYNSGGGRRLQRRYEDEEIPRAVYDEELAGSGDDLDYKGRRQTSGDDDGYDDYDDDRASPLFKVVLVILIVIIIACLLYLGRGVIGTLVNHNTDPTPASSMVSDDQPDNLEDDQTVDPNAGTEPDINDDDPDANGDDDGQNNGSQTNDDPSPVTGTLTLSHEDVSIDGGEDFTLSARSGSGTVTYTSKDPSIATVSASGVVTGVKKGTTEITVQRGSDSAVCIVRVRNTAGGTGDDGDDNQTTTVTPKLNSTDFTLPVGDSYTLKVQGITTEITWSVADSGVATVDGGGKVTGVAVGTTTVTASWDGQKAQCIVRVKAA